MKLLFYEIKKIFTLKIFCICLAAFFVINCGALWYSQSLNEQTALIHSNQEKYEKLLKEYSAMDAEIANEKLAREATIGNIINLIVNGASVFNSQEFLDTELEAQRVMFPDEYNEATKRIDGNYDKAYYDLLNDISVQLYYIDTYKEFIDGIEKRAENKLLFSAMSEDGGFSRKNILKTPQDFKAVKDVTPEIGNYKCLENSTVFQLTDYLLIVLIILMCIALFVVERENKLFMIVRSTAKGHFPTIVAKLSALVILTFTLSVIFLGSNILISGIYTGFGNLSADVQSSGIMMNCPFRFSVIQYLVLWVLTKSASLCLLAVVFSTVFLLIKNSALDYIISLIIVAVEYVLYTFIDSTFFLNQFKYINIFAFLWDNNTLGNYLNLNIFGEAVSLTTVFIVVTVIAFMVLVSISIFAYVKSARFAGSKVSGKLFEKIGAFFSLHFNSVNIFKTELRKTIFRGVTLATFIFLCFFAYSQYTKNIEIRYFDAKKSCYAGYMLELGGEITPSKEKYIKNEQKFLNSIDEQIEEIKADDSISQKEKESKVDALRNMQNVRVEAFDEVLKQYQYSKNAAKQLNIKPQMIDRDIGNLLVSMDFREWQQFVIMLVFIIIVLPQIFANEYKNKSDVLLRTCKKGRLELVINKVLVAFLISTFAYILIYLPFVINFAKIYGTEILNIPIVFVEKFSGVNSDITIMQYFILVSIARIALLSVLVMIALGISVWLKNAITSMTLMTAIVLVPTVGIMLNDTVRFSALFANGMWVYVVPVMCVVSLVLIMTLFIIVLNKFSNTSVRSHKYGNKNI